MSRKIILLLLSLVFGLSSLLYAQDLSGIYQDDQGTFFFSIPSGWRLEDFPYAQHKMISTDPVDGVTPNILVTEAVYTRGLSDYVDRNLEAMESSFDKFKNLGFDEFVSNSELKGFKLTVESHQGNRVVRQYLYFFEGLGGKMYLITCTAPKNDERNFQRLFDLSMKTFKLLQ